MKNRIYRIDLEILEDYIASPNSDDPFLEDLQALIEKHNDLFVPGLKVVSLKMQEKTFGYERRIITPNLGRKITI